MSSESLDKLKEQERFLITKLREANHELEDRKKTLSGIEQKNVDYGQEIDSMVKSNDIKNLQLQSKVKQLKTKIEDKKALCVETEAKQLETILLLKTEVKALTDAVQHKASVKVKKASIHTTTTKENDMRKEISEKRLVLNDMQEQIQTLSNAITSEEQELDEIREILTLARMQQKEATDLLLHSQHELARIKGEWDQLGGANKQETKSLFDEVNDRRVEFKNKLEELKKKCVETEKETADVQRQMIIVNQQQRELTQILKAHPLDSNNELNSLIATYRDTLSLMIKVKSEYEKLSNEIQELEERGLPEDICRFYENTIKTKNDERARLKEIRYREFLRNRKIYTDINEAKRQLYKYKDEENQLSEQICELQLAIENEKRAPPEKENIEIYDAVPQSKPEAKVEKTVQFTEDVVDPPQRRRGGRVLECKTFHFPSLTKKKGVDEQ